MQFSNELKVGAAIILAAIAAFVGIRFFQDLPLFGSSYTLYADFEEAGGVKGGNPVRMRGVNVGSVENVRLNEQEHAVRVELQLQEDVRIPEGSYARVSGLSALGDVHISIEPGPMDNPPLAGGATLQPPPEKTTLKKLTEQAPLLASRADSVLTGANETLAGLRLQLQDPESDFRQTLASLRQMSGSLEDVTEAEKQNIRRLIQNLEQVSEDLRTFTGENSDSMGVAVSRVNRSLTRLNRTLTSLEQTSARLDTIATKLNRGDGTAGRLINDPSLYMKIDSAATHTNRLLKDFQENPNRYLEDMTLVKMF